MKLSLIQKGGLLVVGVLLGAAADRLLFQAKAASDRVPADESASPSILTSSARAPMSAELANKLDRFVNRDNTAEIWASLAERFPLKDTAEVRTALAAALKAPLKNEHRPWKDPARPGTEALVELLLLWEVPEMATDLLVETPGRVGVGLLMRVFRVHYQKDATTARSLAAAMPKDDWSDLSWLARDDEDTSPTPSNGAAKEPWAWDLPDPLAETESCLAALDALSPHERRKIIRGMYRGVPVSNLWKGYPEIAARFVERLPSGANERGNEVSKVALALAQKDPKKALAWLDSLDDYASTETGYSQVMEAYAERDPKAAAAGIESSASSRRSQHAVHVVASQWASEDPQAALAWAKGVEDPELRQMAVQAGLGRWGFDDAKSALTVALEEVGPGRQDALSAVFQSYGQANFDAAWKEAQLLEGENFSIAVGGMLEYSIGSGLDDLGRFEDAVNAYAASEPSLPEHMPFDPVVKEYARALVRQDAPRALEWALSLPAGEMRVSSLNGVFSNLADEDPYAASEILSALTPGRDRDAAITAAFDGLNDRDPERAFQWAMSVESNETQLELTQRAIRYWSGDVRALQVAVEENADLAPTTREQLLQDLETRQSR